MIDFRLIKKKRKEQKLSVIQLADKLGVSKDALYKWEKGTTPSNPVDYLKLEGWLGVKLEIPPPEKPPKPPAAPLQFHSGSKAIDNLSEANLILAKNNEALVSLIQPIVDVAKGSSADRSGLIKDLQDLMKEISSGRRKMTTQDALKELQKVVSEYSPGR